jgi:uncharacterized protein
MGVGLFATPALTYFLQRDLTEKNFNENPEHLDRFCELDDSDVMASIKVWQKHDDKILSDLCKMLILRKLYKVSFSSESLASYLTKKRETIGKERGIPQEHMHYYVFTGQTSNSTYNINDELIKIETKSGVIKNITEMDDTLVSQALARAVHKNYICYVQ